CGQQRLERRARYEFEYGVQDAVGRFPRVDHPDDVRVRELATESHLAPEAVGLHPDVLAPVFRVQAQDLECDLLRGRQLASLVHPTEAALAELAQDLVATLEDHRDLQVWLGGERHDGYRGSESAARLRAILWTAGRIMSLAACQRCAYATVATLPQAKVP